MKTFNVRLVFLLCFALVASACSGGAGDSGAGEASAPSALSYTSPQMFAVGNAITTLMPSVTGTVVSYSVTPALPAGLSLDSATGQITGTPTTVTPVGFYVITAQNANGASTFSLSITVNAATHFLLAPTSDTTIGVGQAITVFASLQISGAPLPSFIAPTAITWSSSQADNASIDANGIVTGLKQGSTLITAHYESYSSELNVLVSGAFVNRTVAVNGEGNRSYSIYVPSFDGDASPHAMILALHGGGGSPMIQASTSLLNKFAQAQKIYVAYLQGTGTISTFNGGACCGTAQTQNIDDVLYAQTVLDDIQNNYNVNAAKIFATGFSNGAIMTHRLDCALSNRFAAVAIVSGGSGEFDYDLNRYYTCNPARPIPILEIHATNDRNYPFAGGVGDGISSTNFYPVDSSVADWIARNNVTNQAVVENVTSTTTCYHYNVAADTGKSSAPVILCKINPVDVYDAVNQIVFGGGHSWPGGVRSPSAKSDVPITDFDADAYMWSFFNQ